jgi:hypothetical protein
MSIPVRHNYEEVLTTWQSLRIRKKNEINKPIFDTIKNVEPHVIKPILLDLFFSYSLSLVLIANYTLNIKRLFSNVYIQLPFYIPGIVVDFPPFGMINKLGWISLSIISSIIISIIYSSYIKDIKKLTAVVLLSGAMYWWVCQVY